MIEIKECLVCAAAQSQIFLQPSYFRGQRKKFTLRKCSNCGFCFTSPRPQEGSELNAYYDTDDYVSHTEKSDGLIDRLFRLAQKFTLKQKHHWVEKHTGGKAHKILDYGAGAGAFLDLMRHKGAKVQGVEPSAVARQQAAKKGLDLISPEDWQQSSETYDAITLWHVLEHLPNLSAVLKRLCESLSPQGKLFVAVPNRECLDAAHYGEYWAAWDVPLHLHHFRKQDIKALAEKNNMRVEAVYPMLLDAYYVSMLSEKNKGNSSLGGLIKSLWWGTLSNLRGYPRNTSSLVYVLERKARLN